MAIYLHLQTHTMGPKEVNRITKAYERALRVLSVKDRDDSRRKSSRSRRPVSKTPHRFQPWRSKNWKSGKGPPQAGGLSKPLILVAEDEYPLQGMVEEALTEAVLKPIFSPRRRKP
jgi:hypothetical protein